MKTSIPITSVVFVAAALFSVVATAFHPHSRSWTKQGSQANHPVPTVAKTAESRLFETIEGSVENDSIPTVGKENPDIAALKSDLVRLAERTNRGFSASADDKRTAQQLVESLQRFQSVPEPARSYYDPSAISAVKGDDRASQESSCGIAGKWTLIYTDAPDITGLDTSRNPFSTAKLGRIGQECDPPFIKNVIEWLRPDWARGLPLSGSDEARILQKVVTRGSATPAKPTLVELKVAGLELGAAGGGDDGAGDSGGGANVVETLRSRGLPAGILSVNPVDLKGPLNPPFGRFEILYLDDEIRAIRTSQNFLAVNRRIVDKEDEWF